MGRISPIQYRRVEALTIINLESSNARKRDVLDRHRLQPTMRAESNREIIGYGLTAMCSLAVRAGSGFAESRHRVETG